MRAHGDHSPLQYARQSTGESPKTVSSSIGYMEEIISGTTTSAGCPTYTVCVLCPPFGLGFYVQRGPHPTYARVCHCMVVFVYDVGVSTRRGALYRTSLESW